jgi:hypothetical protein
MTPFAVLVNGLVARFCVEPKVERILPGAVELLDELHRGVMHEHDIVYKRIDGRGVPLIH